MESGEIVAVGHVGIRSRDLPRTVAFYREAVGLKQVVKSEYFNAFEVGHVHLCITPGDPGDVHFDLTTDDIDACHDRLRQKEVPCTGIEENTQAHHRYFTFTDPDGHEITVYTAHDPDMPAIE